MQNKFGFEQAKVKYEPITDQHGLLIVEPLERGYGLTIGNSLRRIMLSSLPGAAISKVKFDGIHHEFSSIPGVKEEVPEIIMNLKSLAIRSDLDEEVTFRFDFQGEGVVRASDIKTPAGIEIVNKDQEIATLSDKSARLGMKLTITNGRGYDGANTRVDTKEIDEIFVDALYTPIERVNMKVENTRVGQNTDLDKVTLDIYTNGTMSPNDAASLAAKVLAEHLKLIVNLSVEAQNAEVMAEKETPAEVEVLDISIDQLGLSTRAENGLRREKIETVAQLCKKTEAEIRKIRNVGSKTIDEILNVLKENGYELDNGEN